MEQEILNKYLLMLFVWRRAVVANQSKLADQYNEALKRYEDNVKYMCDVNLIDYTEKIVRGLK